MQWQLHDRGFLPMHDPLQEIGDPSLKDIERLGADLPCLVHERRFREATADYLAGPFDWDAIARTISDAEIERLFKLFSYFASSYVHAPGLPAVDRIPPHLGVPLVRLAQQVERPPILA